MAPYLLVFFQHRHIAMGATAEPIRTPMISCRTMLLVSFSPKCHLLPERTDEQNASASAKKGLSTKVMSKILQA